DTAITEPVAPVSRRACIFLPLSACSPLTITVLVKSVPEPIL
ncbi:hypothetical protein ADUPG1_003972, partial [Aduncisulcus paluster]